VKARGTAGRPSGPAACEVALALNFKAAKALSLTVLASPLAQIDEVIE
jgi:hypothetical protein